MSAGTAIYVDHPTIGSALLTRLRLPRQKRPAGVELSAFARLLRDRRQSARLTQMEVADRAKLSQSYVSGIERGVNRRISRDDVLSLARAIGGSEREFLIAAGFAPDAETPRRVYLVEGTEVELVAQGGSFVIGKLTKAELAALAALIAARAGNDAND